MKNNSFIMGAVTLVIGIAIGYGIWGTNYSNDEKFSSGAMMHQMSDGSMMNGAGKMNMSEMMDGMMSGLANKTGDEFDKEFLSEMVVHHEGAVLMAQAVLKESKRPELIKLANDIIGAQTKEIEMMKGWQKTWFNQ